MGLIEQHLKDSLDYNYQISQLKQMIDALNIKVTQLEAQIREERARTVDDIQQGLMGLKKVTIRQGVLFFTDWEDRRPRNFERAERDTQYRKSSTHTDSPKDAVQPPKQTGLTV